MKNFIITIVSGILFVDFFSYFMWAASGQSPVDGFYIGAITAKVISVLTTLIG